MKEVLEITRVGAVTPVEDISKKPVLSLERLQQHARNLYEVEGGIPLAVYVYGSELALRVNCQFINPDACIERVQQILPSLAARGADRIVLLGEAELQHGDGVVVSESRPGGSTTYVGEVADDGSLGPWLPPEHSVAARYERLIASAWGGEASERSNSIYLLERGVAIDVPGSGFQCAPRVTAEQLRCQAEKEMESRGEVRLRAHAYGPGMSVCLDFEDLNQAARSAAIPNVLSHLAEQGAELLLLQCTGPLREGYGVVVIESRADGDSMSAATLTEHGTLGPWGEPNFFAEENPTRVFRQVWRASGRETSGTVNETVSTSVRAEEERALPRLQPSCNAGGATSVDDLSGRPLLTVGKLREHARNLHEIEGYVPVAAYLYGDSVALRVDVQEDERDPYNMRLKQALSSLSALGVERILLYSAAAARNGDGVIVCDSRRDGTVIYFAAVRDDGTLGPWISADGETKESVARLFGAVWGQVPEPCD